MGEGDSGRVAFVGAKRLGCAVVRNRSKRVMREAARQPVDSLVAGYDIFVRNSQDEGFLAAGDGQGVAFAYETRRALPGRSDEQSRFATCCHRSYSHISTGYFALIA